MTATTAAPLDNLAQQIARQQAELETLRREFENRQSRLADLTTRKEELTAQLQQVEADIQATTQGSSTHPVSTPAPASLPHPPARSPKPARTQTLPALLLEIVQQATGPVTVKRLAEEVQHRKFPTTTGNLRKLVGIKVGLLVNKGLLRRAPDQAGVLPAKPAAGAKPAPGKATRGVKKDDNSGSMGTMAVAAAKPEGQPQKRSLRVLLANLLAKSRRPLAARELAGQALAGGYTTKSKNFINVIWVALGQMEAVENVAGQGWQLTKR